ncbi:4296_t:CDS:2, partial [Racocetra persica]
GYNAIYRRVQKKDLSKNTKTKISNQQANHTKNEDIAVNSTKYV